jgi:signal peptidase I
MDQDAEKCSPRPVLFVPFTAGAGKIMVFALAAFCCTHYNGEQGKGIWSMTDDLSSRRQGRKAAAAVFEYLETLITAAILVVLLCTFAIRMVRVEGRSMVPTLGDGDFLISYHLFYQPQRGDIVVITKPNEISTPLIKRVIAVGGDEIDIDFEVGTVTLNGELLEEPFLSEPTHYQPEQSMQFPLTVPPGQVFAMGDNRNHSSDSRDARIGLVDERYIMGKTFFRLAPFGQFGLI